MTTYYIEKNNKILLYDTNETLFMNSYNANPDYFGLEIKTSDRPIVDYEFADTESYKEKQKEIEKQRINNLSLTAADVERAIYKAKGMDFEDIIELVKNHPEIDIKALKIELKANNFFRGNPYIGQIGAILGFSSLQLDKFFETGDFKELVNETVV